MKSVLKGLTFAILTVTFGLAMAPKASAELFMQPGFSGGGCGTCQTLVQPAVIDNGCNTCGGLYGGGLYGSGILTQPAIYGGPSFYGRDPRYGIPRRFSPYRGFWY